MAVAALIVDIAGWWLTAGAVVAVAFLGTFIATVIIFALAFFVREY